MTNMAYQLELNNRQIIWLQKALKPNKQAVAGELGKAVRRAGVILQTQAIKNVSGFPVFFEGGAFRVRVQTGALKGSISLQYPYGDQYRARVYVNGAHTSTGMRGFTKPKPVSDYAGAIEWGHGPIDLKKTMMGKIVPFYGARGKNATGPYAATGLKRVPAGPAKNDYSSTRLNRRLSQKGKRPMYFKKVKPDTGGSYFISFRTVGKTGWVIPAAKPRPFMRAALTNVKGRAEGDIIDTAVNALTPAAP